MNYSSERVGGVVSTPPGATHRRPPPNFANDDVAGEALAAMQARAEFWDSTLHKLADGAYFLGRRGDSKAVPCLLPVSDLLRQIGGTR